MRWIKLGAWLLAWSFWVWLGFGLYRELPREPGLRTCSLGGERSNILGFVADSDTIAVNQQSQRPAGADLVLINGRTGDEIGHLPMPNLPPMVMMHVPVSATRR